MGVLSRAGVETAQLLERHLAVEVRLAGDVHDRHAAAPDLPQDLVPPDDVGCLRGTSRLASGHTATPRGRTGSPTRCRQVAATCLHRSPPPPRSPPESWTPRATDDTPRRRS